jgi:molybdenum cofactor cytidylyltransferase
VRQPLILHALAPWLEVFEQIHLVTPINNQQLTGICRSVADRINFIKADKSDLGMGHSLATGIQATQQAKGWLIGLADMPMITADILELLVSELKQGAAISAPFYHGKRGHPVAFSNQYRDDLMQLTGDVGAKTIVQAHETLIQAVNIDTLSIFIDIDTQADLSLLQ